jgi:hypothetical protein
LAEKRRKEDVEKNNEEEDSDGKRKTSREEYRMKQRCLQETYWMRLLERVTFVPLLKFSNKIQD